MVVIWDVCGSFLLLGVVFLILFDDSVHTCEKINCAHTSQQSSKNCRNFQGNLLWRCCNVMAGNLNNSQNFSSSSVCTTSGTEIESFISVKRIYMLVVKHVRVIAPDNSHRGAISGMVPNIHIQIDNSFAAIDFYFS